MMNMPAIDRDPLKWSKAVDDRDYQEANRAKGDEEAHRGQEQPPPRPIRELFMNDPAQAGEMQQEEQNSDHQGDKDEENRETGQAHKLIIRAQRCLGLPISPNSKQEQAAGYDSGLRARQIGEAGNNSLGKEELFRS